MRGLLLRAVSETTAMSRSTGRLCTPDRTYNEQRLTAKLLDQLKQEGKAPEVRHRRSTLSCPSPLLLASSVGDSNSQQSTSPRSAGFGSWASDAPGGTRTCGRLLRRQLLCPLSYRGMASLYGVLPAASTRATTALSAACSLLVFDKGAQSLVHGRARQSAQDDHGRATDALAQFVWGEGSIVVRQEHAKDGIHQRQVRVMSQMLARFADGALQCIHLANFTVTDQPSTFSVSRCCMKNSRCSGGRWLSKYTRDRPSRSTIRSLNWYRRGRPAGWQAIEEFGLSLTQGHGSDKTPYSPRRAQSLRLKRVWRK